MRCSPRVNKDDTESPFPHPRVTWEIWVQLAYPVDRRRAATEGYAAWRRIILCLLQICIEEFKGEQSTRIGTAKGEKKACANTKKILRPNSLDTF